jgi:hypothetical protein
MWYNSESMGLFDKIFKNDNNVEQLFDNFITYEDPKKIFSIQLPIIYSPDKPLVNRLRDILLPDDESISFSCDLSEEIFRFSCGEGTFEIYIFKNTDSINLDEFFQSQKEKGYLKNPFFLAEQKRTPEPIVERISLASNPVIKVSYTTEGLNVDQGGRIMYHEIIYLVNNGEYLFRLMFASKKGRYQSRYIDNIQKIWESFKILR